MQVSQAQISYIKIQFGQKSTNPKVDIDLEVTLNKLKTQQIKSGLEEIIKQTIAPNSLVVEFQSSNGTGQALQEFLRLMITNPTNPMYQGFSPILTDQRFEINFAHHHTKAYLIIVLHGFGQMLGVVESQLQLDNEVQEHEVKVKLLSDNIFNGFFEKNNNTAKIYGSRYFKNLYASIEFVKTNNTRKIIGALIELFFPEAQIALNIYDKFKSFSVDVKCASSDILPQKFHEQGSGVKNIKSDPFIVAFRDKILDHANIHFFSNIFSASAKVRLSDFSEFLMILI